MSRIELERSPVTYHCVGNVAELFQSKSQVVVRVDALRLHRVRGLQNPGGFDFGAFMQRQGIYAMGGVSNPSRLHVQHRPAGFHVARTLERWRQQLAAQARACLPEPYDTVFLAMVLGQAGNANDSGRLAVLFNRGAHAVTFHLPARPGHAWVEAPHGRVTLGPRAVAFVQERPA